MKKSFAAMLLLSLLASSAQTQPPRTRVISHPTLPNREMLRRMEMDLLWHLKIPRYDDLRDGLFSIQVIPGDSNPQVILQTMQGEVMLLDGETGTIVWRNNTLARAPLTGMFPCAYNSHSIYVVRDDVLYILDRPSGVRMLYTFNPATRVRDFYAFALYDTTPSGSKKGIRPPLAKPYATPVADEDHLYYTAGDRVVGLSVPNYKALGEPIPIESSSRKPSVLWVMFTGNVGVKHAPIVTPTQVGVVKVDGTFMSLEPENAAVRFPFKTAGRVGGAMGVHSIYTARKQEATAYVGSYDQTLYAINLFTGRDAWRFFAPGPILRKPYVNDRDVFIKVEKGPFYRIDRSDGREVWSNKQALQFMACNRLFVYTRDATGSLLIHDYIRGTVLAEWDFRDWGISVPNELTDRVYLAHNDGQLLCLGNHDYPRPAYMKTVPFETPRPFAPKKTK